MDDEDELFDWAASAYEQPQPSQDKSDWDGYKVNLGTIDKDPTTGDETLTGFEVTKPS